MTPESWRKVAPLFEAAARIDPAERRAFLERACAGDGAAVALVLDLLSHDRQADREGLSPQAADATATHTDSGARRVQVVLDLDSGLVQTAGFEGLLRARLRVCAAILLLGLSAFLVKNLLDGTYLQPDTAPRLYAQLIALLLDAAVLGALRGRGDRSVRFLRGLEWVLIGVGASFFTLYQLEMFRFSTWGEIPSGPVREELLNLTAHSTVLQWFAFVVGYGLVIPNTWGRCARVVLGIALAPVALTLAIGYREDTLGELADPLVEMVLWLGIATAMAVYGSHKITQLTREAREARRFGQYELKQLLGSGGMGEVYLAEHALLKRPCAIKLIRPERAGDARTLSRFEREVRATARLKHPNVVEVYDYGRTEDGRFYYVMEYLAGPTLDQLVARDGPLPPGRAVALLRQVCGALGEAHAIGLIHRDLKPGNVIVTCQGGRHDLAKLLDFGLVQDLGASPGDGAATEFGLIMGTPAYMSPEQASGASGPLDPRSDLYSLGCLGYFAMTGHPVFEGDSVGRLIAAHLTQPPPDVADARPDVPTDLAAVIRRCLAKAPADRFADAPELERALRDCRCADDWSEDAAAAWWRSRDGPDVLADRPIDGQGCPSTPYVEG